MFREMRRKKQAIDETACLEIPPEHITGKKSRSGKLGAESSWRGAGPPA